MVKIRNTRPDVKRTRSLFDAETMGDHYDPPGIRFTESDGEVARIKSECVDAVVEKFDHLEIVTEDELDDGMNGPVDSDDGELETEDDDPPEGPPDHARDGDSPIDGGPPADEEGDGPDDDAGDDPADDEDDGDEEDGPGESGANGRNDNNGERGNN